MEKQILDDVKRQSNFFAEALKSSGCNFEKVTQLVVTDQLEAKTRFDRSLKLADEIKVALNWLQSEESVKLQELHNVKISKIQLFEFFGLKKAAGYRLLQISELGRQQIKEYRNAAAARGENPNMIELIRHANKSTNGKNETEKSNGEIEETLISLSYHGDKPFKIRAVKFSSNDPSKNRVELKYKDSLNIEDITAIYVQFGQYMAQMDIPTE